MRSDQQIREEVQETLDRDPKIGARDIAVAVRSGVVTLAGFVRAVGEKSRAEVDTRRVVGVLGIANDIEVRLPLFGRKPDPEIAREVLASIKREMPTVCEQILVRVADGRVTLQGQVESQNQKALAEKLAGSATGVRSISNELAIRLPIPPIDIQRKIEEAFKRAAEIDADNITVEIAPDGTIVLSGAVRSPAEREEAERIAAAAPGILEVENRIEVLS
jgi:osmotically-inducible protein OsmY